MDWKETCRRLVPENLDAHGDIAPPWEKFPTFERYTIGWRMGYGETWLGIWGVFLEQLGPSYAARLAYLKRHAPAPFTWADAVQRVLRPRVVAGAQGDSDEEEDSYDEDEEDSEELDHRARNASWIEQGLIASDIAFSTWLRQQTQIQWPWLRAESPEEAARHWTRELWFWSRQVQPTRQGRDWVAPPVPEAWESCRSALETGQPGVLELSCGLSSLARMLAAGQVLPPWQLGLPVSSFQDSFDDDMAYADAFRLWVGSAFDDSPHFQRYLARCSAPPEKWRAWLSEHVQLV